jgi:hypothetical protein
VSVLLDTASGWILFTSFKKGKTLLWTATISLASMNLDSDFAADIEFAVAFEFPKATGLLFAPFVLSSSAKQRYRR